MRKQQSYSVQINGRKSSFIIVAFIICLFSLCQSSLKVDRTTSSLMDQFGRYRVIHGINSVYKQFPYYPTRTVFNYNDSLIDEDFINLKKWGFNSIRLYLAWQGFQPKRSQYNYTYLQVLKQIIQEAQKYNISILLDAHHDLYSKKFCGEGFPSWLVEKQTFPNPVDVKLQYDAQGYPTKESCQKVPFFKYYSTGDVQRFAYDFFTNKNGMNDKFIQMWIKVVEYFQPVKNIIGYEIINQPSGANAYISIYDFIAPGINNNKYLLPFYQKIFKQIRNIEKKKLLFFQPTVFDYLGGFYQSPGDQEYKNLDVLSFHQYCTFMFKTGSKQCNLVDGYQTHHRYSNIKKLKIGGVLTEFGNVFNDQPSLKQLKNVLKYVDNYKLSWYYWQFKYNNDFTCATDSKMQNWHHSLYYNNGSLQIQKLKILSHPYAYAICGQKAQQTYTDSSYKISWIPFRCNGKNTEIFISEDLYFKKGFQIQFKPACQKCKLRQISKSYLQVVLDDSMINKPMSLSIAGYI